MSYSCLPPPYSVPAPACTFDVAPHQLQHRVIRRRLRLAGQGRDARQEEDGAHLSIWDGNESSVRLAGCSSLLVYMSVGPFVLCTRRVFWGVTCLPAAVEKGERLEAPNPFVEGNAACPPPQHPRVCTVYCLLMGSRPMTHFIDPSRNPSIRLCALTDQRRLSHVRRDLQCLQRPHRHAHHQQRPQGACGGGGCDGAAHRFRGCRWRHDAAGAAARGCHPCRVGGKGEIEACFCLLIACPCVFEQPCVPLAMCGSDAVAEPLRVSPKTRTVPTLIWATAYFRLFEIKEKHSATSATKYI